MRKHTDGQIKRYLSYSRSNKKSLKNKAKSILKRDYKDPILTDIYKGLGDYASGNLSIESFISKVEGAVA